MDWLLEAAATYNQESYEQRDRYGCHICIPVETIRTVIQWSMESIPDEVLIGFDPDPERPNPESVEEVFGPASATFSGSGYLLGEPYLCNVGDSFSVSIIPEEWVDGVFSEKRGSRASSFATWMHSHPNAYGSPSQADSEAASWTEGVEMILGVMIKDPPVGLEWYEQEGVHRRRLGLDPDGDLPVLARVAGRKILGFELVGYIRSGLGCNILITDEEGSPIGLDL